MFTLLFVHYLALLLLLPVVVWNQPLVLGGVPSFAMVTRTTGRSNPPVGSGCFCPYIYRPVCTCDGQVYSNACLALCAGKYPIDENYCDPNTGKLGPINHNSGNINVHDMGWLFG